MTEREKKALEHISNHCEKIQEYLSVAKDATDFVNDEILRDAVTLRVLAVGELVKRLSLEFRKEAERIENADLRVDSVTNWKGLAGIRDIVAHEYDNLDFEIIYDTLGNLFCMLLISQSQMLLSHLIFKFITVQLSPEILDISSSPKSFISILKSFKFDM